MAAKLSAVLLAAILAVAPAGAAAQSWCSDSTGRGHFRVYNTQTQKQLGCVSSTGEWTVDGDCAVFFTDNTSLPGTLADGDCKLHTSGSAGGWCQFGGASSTNETLVCSQSIPFDQGAYFRCINNPSANDLVASSYHYTWSWTANTVPTSGHPVPIYWLLENNGSPPANTFDVDLHWSFTSNTS